MLINTIKALATQTRKDHSSLPSNQCRWRPIHSLQPNNLSSACVSAHNHMIHRSLVFTHIFFLKQLQMLDQNDSSKTDHCCHLYIISIQSGTASYLPSHILERTLNPPKIMPDFQKLQEASTGSPSCWHAS